MCAVSMIGDHYQERLPQQYPWTIHTTTGAYNALVSREEFDSLKRDVQEMKALLIRAKIYDEENGEKDCEMAEKIELLKKIAELVGVDLSDIFDDE